MATPTAPSKLKILLVGNSKTGKHCYITRLIHDRYPCDPSNNKGCDISSVKINIEDDTQISVQIINIHGSERGKTKIKKYFKDIHGYIIMFDVTAPETYDAIVRWKQDIDDENKPKNLSCILLANKCDMEKDADVQKQMQEPNNYCEAFGFSAYFETSSKNNTGVQQSFEHLIRDILHRSSSSPTLTPEIPDSPEIPDTPPISQEYTIKIIVIGEISIGKTAIIQRYTRNRFSGRYLITIGTDLALKKIHYKNDIINIHIWDIAGDERFGVMTHLFYKDAAGCLVVFDVSKSRTLDGAVKWKNDFDTKVNFDKSIQIPCVLVGNKCDLPKDGIVMSEPHMENFCRTHKFSRWFETSAKDNINITETFEYLVEEIMQKIVNRTSIRTRTSSGTIRIEDDPLPEQHTLTCCNN